MQARMKNPVALIPGSMQAIQTLNGAIQSSGVSSAALELAHLRASQINGCSACIDYGVKHARKEGVLSDDKLFAVSAWREAPYFSDEERSALALAEAMTRLSDRSDAVPDEIWNEAARHFKEPALAALVLSIAMTNLFNRVNVTTRQIPGAGW